MKNIFLISALLFLSAFISNAQNGTSKPTHVDGTDQHLQWMKQQDPSLQQKMEIEDKKFDNYVAAHRSQLKNNKTAYILPVVVHVVYNGSLGKVTPLQVQEQIDITNRDWSGLNPHSMGPFPDSLKANSGITLCLATKDPSGNATTGIDWKTTTISSFGTNDGVKKTANGGAAAWDPTKYLNIWVCNMGNSLCGYAQFPSSGINSTFGVVIHYQFFGTSGASAPYNQGGTMTHELGHCFNLSHLTGDASCPDVDGCPDTPTEFGTQTTMGNCVVDQCNDTCPGIMYMNFMSYALDSIYANYTPDQVARMQATVVNYLMSVTNNAASACGAVGIQEDNDKSDFTVYPNPANYNLFIETTSINKNTLLTISNLQGQILLEKKLVQFKTAIDISGFPEGIYVIRIGDEKKNIVKRFIKE